MAENNSGNDTPMAGNKSRDVMAEIDICLTQAIGIVDLLGNGNNEGMDDDSVNNASWAAKDLIKRAQSLMSTLNGHVAAQGTTI